MASERIGDMTKAELEAFVLQVIARRYPQYPYVQKSDRPVAELLEALRRNMIETKPGEPSTLQLLREDRDR